MFNDFAIPNPEAIISQRHSAFSGLGSFPRLPKSFENSEQAIVVCSLWVIDFDHPPRNGVVSEVAVYGHDCALVTIGQHRYCQVFSALP